MDLIVALILLVLVTALCIAHAVRVALRGTTAFDRVDRMGGSALVSKRWMEAAYWALQPFSKVCIALGVTANAVTWTSFALGLASGVLIALGKIGLAALLAAFSCTGDALDGLIARESLTASHSGEVLDAAVDRYTEFFILGGLLLAYRTDLPIFVLALLALLGSFMVSYSTAKAEALHVEPPRGLMRRVERAVYLIAALALTPLARSSTTRFGLLPVVADLPLLVGLGLIAAIANLSAARRFAALSRTLRACEARSNSIPPPPQDRAADSRAPAAILSDAELNAQR